MPGLRSSAPRAARALRKTPSDDPGRDALTVPDVHPSLPLCVLSASPVPVHLVPRRQATGISGKPEIGSRGVATLIWPSSISAGPTTTVPWLPSEAMRTLGRMV